MDLMDEVIWKLCPLTSIFDMEKRQRTLSSVIKVNREKCTKSTGESRKLVVRFIQIRGL